MANKDSEQTPNSSSEKASAQSNNKLIAKLLLATVGMFCFAVFLLPPLYEVFCDITGLNGKYDTGGRVPIADFQKNNQDASNEREITVQFVADASSDVNWPFYPTTRSVRVTPGSIQQIYFRVENPKATPIVARAIPSISPGQASLYMKKTQCFCFMEQPLAPFEGKDMGLVFYIDPKMPEDIRELTLSYRLYDITDEVGAPETDAS